MAYEVHEDDMDQWEHEHDFRIVWGCPNGCGEEYEEPRGYNEAMPCSECGARCVKKGESYS